MISAFLLVMMALAPIVSVPADQPARIGAVR